MKKPMLMLMVCLLLTGCSTEPQVPDTTPETTPVQQLANPWKDYPSLEEAEAACGLDFPLEDVVADSYKAETCRVMNGQLLEVTYRDDSFEVTVRMQAGEGQDISGVYAEYKDIFTYEEETYTIVLKYIQGGGILQLISKNGYSYSFYAPNHYWGDSNTDFLAFLTE